MHFRVVPSGYESTAGYAITYWASSSGRSEFLPKMIGCCLFLGTTTKVSHDLGRGLIFEDIVCIGILVI